MRQAPEFQYDVATAVTKGARDYQEDAIVTDFQIGAELGFAVLADGMGGHAAGDVASKIIVTEVFSELKLQSSDPENFENRVGEILTEAALSANQCINGHVRSHPDATGMGATLVAPVLIRNRLFWISVGDSPLYLFRDGELRQLNEDHSMAPQIDFMIKSGLIGAETGRNHPDRHCLTSVLIGDEVARIDCPSEPFEVVPGDILIVASDGLQTLENSEIEALLRDNRDAAAEELVRLLLERLEQAADPDQDNATFSVIRIENARETQSEGPPKVRFFSRAGSRSQNAGQRTATVVRPRQFRKRKDGAG